MLLIRRSPMGNDENLGNDVYVIEKNVFSIFSIDYFTWVGRMQTKEYQGWKSSKGIIDVDSIKIMNIYLNFTEVFTRRHTCVIRECLLYYYDSLIIFKMLIRWGFQSFCALRVTWKFPQVSFGKRSQLGFFKRMQSLWLEPSSLLRNPRTALDESIVILNHLPHAKLVTWQNRLHEMKRYVKISVAEALSSASCEVSDVAEPFTRDEKIRHKCLLPKLYHLS